MLGFLKSNKKSTDEDVNKTISENLRDLYMNKLLPLEKAYNYHAFHSPPLEDADFAANPMILLIGQYSTGKTTFIRYLLEQDFPGIRIGPEPTTDRFIAVMHGDHESIIPGNALVIDPKRQFRPLSAFGNNFCNRFQCSMMPNKVLESLTVIDTPGILSGEKQRLDRGYEFTGVIEWFAERTDRILLLFDAHKLDISDEFRRVIECLKGFEDKIRIVLNKSDMVDSQQLMRVYGALMWSLGKVLQTPEVARVYIGSFWDQPLHFDTNKLLFELEEKDLFHDLQSLPGNTALRKLNDLIKRARLAKVHAYIISHLKSQMPSMIGKDNKKKELIANLQRTFDQISKEYSISPGDFPNLAKMQEDLAKQDFKNFSALKPKLIETVDNMLSTDIARVMQLIPQEQQQYHIADRTDIKGGAFQTYDDNPFGCGTNEGINSGRYSDEWIVSKERYKHDELFDSLNPTNGKLSGSTVKQHLVQSKLPYQVLGKIWKLSDVDQDGSLDADEFALACYLVKLKVDGNELPNSLPDHLIPPSKR